MPIGIEVCLGPRDFVLDGDPVATHQKGGGPPPQFSVHFYCGQMAGCIKMPLGTKVGLVPGHIVLDGDPAPPKRRTFPHFRPMSIVAKRASVHFSYY